MSNDNRQHASTDAAGSTSREGAPKYSRQTSFARSFFEVGDQTKVYNWSEDDSGDNSGGGARGTRAHPSIQEEDHQDQLIPEQVPVPRSRPLGRMVSRRKLNSHSNDSIQSSFASSRPAVEQVPVAASGHEEEEDEEEEARMRPGSPVERQSWYREALGQGISAENLNAFLAIVDQQDDESSNNDLRGEFDDEEVLEQYRIMAHHEARQRVKENLGYDVAEYIAEKRASKPSAPERSEPKKPNIPLPDYCMPTIETNKKLPKSEPTIPMPIYRERFLKQRCKRPTELQTGQLLSESDDATSTTNDGSHITVQCLGCRSQLRVDANATLVNCPECAVISPASSTRRDALSSTSATSGLIEC